jgi:nicotinamide riboside kinase
LNRRRPQLYLLACIDVPWTADGAQRDRGHMREEMQALFQRALERLGARFVQVHGSQTDRLETALGVIARL